MSILGLHHVQVTVPFAAEEEARRFYCDLLGLEEIEKPDSLKARGGFWAALGDRQLHVSLEDGVERRKTKAHVAYQVADLAAWRERLAAHGVAIVESIPIPGHDRFECRDPFGNRMEFIEAL